MTSNTTKYNQEWYQKNRERLHNKRISRHSKYQGLSYASYLNARRELVRKDIEHLLKLKKRLQDRIALIEEALKIKEFKLKTGKLRITSKEIYEAQNSQGC